MAEKRKRDSGEKSGDYGKGGKKLKRGFVVGPDHLPDGPYKRKTQKIKSALIQRAQIKKNYAKLKRQGKMPDGAQKLPPAASIENEDETHEPNVTPHPDRQTLMDKDSESPELEQNAVEQKRRQRKPKSVPFKREYEQAQKRRAEAEERRIAREEAERQRQLKAEERERFRKAMGKARKGGPHGQRKLGRESKVLLERVKRMVGDHG